MGRGVRGSAKERLGGHQDELRGLGGAGEGRAEGGAAVGVKVARWSAGRGEGRTSGGKGSGRGGSWGKGAAVGD
jgi:hypothetical protein